MASNAKSSEISPNEAARKAYILPNNRKEIERMKNQHEWIKGSFGGLIKAPIDFETKNQKILDSAAADGTWLCDVSSLFPPETELVGFDIAPELYPPPETLPANIRLVLGDLTKDLPAEWTANFDLVHQRFIFPSFSVEMIESILERLANCVKPGGWIQLVEPAANENVSGPGPSAFTTLHKIANLFMQCPSPKETVLSHLTKLGFVNINVHSVDIVIGKFQDNSELDIRGRKSMRAAFNNIHEVLDMSQEDWSTLLDRFDRDLGTYRTAVRHHIIWAQRPDKA
ncbi:S-adenosyl-L-methionine-dependent methyltransferase [Trichoderma citrinoviride]|uniref:S-adenosyl-L-methionine-dependent methyltransferase n=1 Tax=Trichoderma citrinoviride TaxID=58853 RepID=A0A2T4AZ14_9HYPO|nr:S-adenosyl-L-methionine-dependent methyltransferase [Trichoderma citrinoviride]PTB62211.1 S-adenosyl-L-methionine-dependent methyltransferase [Trichoderma citrinoviride]